MTVGELVAAEQITMVFIATIIVPVKGRANRPLGKPWLPAKGSGDMAVM
jgi:hypothetical protein